MAPYIRGMLARHSGRSSFDNPYPWACTWHGSNAQKWKIGYCAAGRTPYKQLIPALKVLIPVAVLIFSVWVVGGMDSPELPPEAEGAYAPEYEQECM